MTKLIHKISIREYCKKHLDINIDDININAFDNDGNIITGFLDYPKMDLEKLMRE